MSEARSDEWSTPRVIYPWRGPGGPFLLSRRVGGRGDLLGELFGGLAARSEEKDGREI